MEVKRGTRVSLNKRIRSYYFQGPNGINLRAGVDDTAIIPEDITDRNLAIIQRSVERGQLIMGWVKEPEIKTPDRRDDSKLLDMNVKKMQPYLEQIAKTSGKHENAPVARLEILLSLEKDDKNRKTVTEKIEELLGMMGGISAVEEDAKDKEEIAIQIV